MPAPALEDMQKEVQNANLASVAQIFAEFGAIRTTKDGKLKTVAVVMDAGTAASAHKLIEADMGLTPARIYAWQNNEDDYVKQRKEGVSTVIRGDVNGGLNMLAKTGNAAFLISLDLMCTAPTLTALGTIGISMSNLDLENPCFLTVTFYGSPRGTGAAMVEALEEIDPNCIKAVNNMVQRSAAVQPLRTKVHLVFSVHYRSMYHMEFLIIPKGFAQRAALLAAVRGAIAGNIRPLRLVPVNDGLGTLKPPPRKGTAKGSRASTPKASPKRATAIVPWRKAAAQQSGLARQRTASARQRASRARAIARARSAALLQSQNQKDAASEIENEDDSDDAPSAAGHALLYKGDTVRARVGTSRRTGVVRSRKQANGCYSYVVAWSDGRFSDAHSKDLVVTARTHTRGGK